MRIASLGHAIFAVTMIALGVLGLVMALNGGGFAPVWGPIPKDVPAREALVYLSAFVSAASGLGLFCRRTAAHSARVLFAFFVVWLLFFKVPYIIQAPSFGAFWPSCETAVMVAGTWIMYTWFATEWERRHLGFLAGAKGLRIARMMYGLVLIFFGSAHFVDLKDTVVLIPGYLPWHVAWAYFTGGAFIAAGAAVLAGVYARLAAALSVVEIGMFLLLVWVPIVAAGSSDASEWSETVVSWALMSSAWVIADSYGGVPWQRGESNTVPAVPARVLVSCRGTENSLPASWVTSDPDTR
jgi:uncharacterized membrane protein